MITLRPATLADLNLLQHWDEQPHVIASNPNDKAVLVDPLANNTRAHRFYERLGFQSVERRRFGQDDCLVYRLDRTDWHFKKSVSYCSGIG